MMRKFDRQTLFVAVLIGSSITVANAQEIDYSNGPVLCAYKFSAQTYEVGRACYAKRDKNFVTEMRKALVKYRDFVVRNTDGNLARVQRNENIARSAVHKNPASVVNDLDSQSCKSIRKAAKDWYNGQIIDQKVKIRDVMDTTNKILAVDRKPTSDGC